MGFILPFLFSLLLIQQVTTTNYDTGYYRLLYEPVPQSFEYFENRCKSELNRIIPMTIIYI